ncbi:hypothetical protein D3C81_1878830 [compost metagenome]
MAPHASRGIHAAHPPDSLRSPFGPAFGCYCAALRFATIPLGLLKGRCRCLTVVAWFQAAVGFNIASSPQARVTPRPPGEGRGRGMFPAGAEAWKRRARALYSDLQQLTQT